jgi:predicted DNA-binding protein (MmcQ/YjbR family)
MSRAIDRTNEALRAFALGLPEAWEDRPWGESVAKVGKKVFAFFGTEETCADAVAVGVKLPTSADAVLAEPGAERMGYNLGKAGWIWAKFTAKEVPPVELICEWIEESYRAVAPKKLIRQLDE